MTKRGPELIVKEPVVVKESKKELPLFISATDDFRGKRGDLGKFLANLFSEIEKFDVPVGTVIAPESLWSRMKKELRADACSDSVRAATGTAGYLWGADVILHHNSIYVFTIIPQITPRKKKKAL